MNMKIRLFDFQEVKLLKLLSMTILLVLLLFPLLATAQNTPGYRIERVKDNVYRFTHEHYHSVFMVTPKDLFLTDPINEKAATYLRDELKERFNVLIRYLAYSHNHVNNHTLGGHVLGSGQVSLIAHAYAAEDIIWTRTPTAIPNLTFREELTVKLGDSRVEL